MFEDLITSKINIDNDINADQLQLIIDLMTGYDKNYLFSEKIKISMMKKSKSWGSEVLNVAKRILCNSKQNPRKGLKSFFPNEFSKCILKEQENILVNLMNLYNDRNNIIKLFEDKNIEPNNFPYNAKSEP